MGAGKVLWQDRDFVLVVAGTTVNNFGDWILELALPVYIYIETGSGISTAMFFVTRLVVGLAFGPVGGLLADRCDLRMTLVVTNLIQGLALAPLLLSSPSRIWPVYFVEALQGLVRSVNDPASFALVPNMVSDDQLVRANGILSAARSLSRLVGAAVGGIAISAGGIAAIVVANGATFMMGAAAAWFMRPIAQASVGSETTEDLSLIAGLQQVRSRPPLVALTWIHGIAMFIFGGFPVLFIVFVTEDLSGSGADVGIARATSAIGGLVGAALVGRIAVRYAPEALMAGAYGVFALLAFGFINASTITSGLWIPILFYAMTGVPNVVSQVGMTSVSQTLCPGAVLGRFGGLLTAIGAVGRGVGAAVAGGFLEVSPARPLLNGQVVLLFICALIGTVFVARPLSAQTASMTT